MSRGDICWVEFPDEKRRPGLVLSRNEAIPIKRDVTIAYLTRTIRGIPTEVRLGMEDGVPTECAISLDYLRTISQRRLTEPITSLSGPRMHEVCKALAIATGCD